MIEVTLGNNLVACERPTFPVLHPLIDLTQDLAAARAAILAAEKFFRPFDDCTYSGWCRRVTALDGKGGPWGPVFYIQLWSGDKVYRTMGVRDLAYTGILHVQLPNNCNPDEAIDRDVIGDACRSFNPVLAETCVAYIHSAGIDLAIPQFVNY